MTPLVLTLIALVSRFTPITDEKACWVTRFEETRMPDCTPDASECVFPAPEQPDVIFFENGIMWDKRIFEVYPRLQGYLHVSGSRFAEGWKNVGYTSAWEDLSNYDFHSFIPSPETYMDKEIGDAGLTIAVRANPYRSFTPIWSKTVDTEGYVRGVLAIYSHEMNIALMYSNTDVVKSYDQALTWLQTHVPEIDRIGFYYSNGTSRHLSFTHLSLGDEKSIGKVLDICPEKEQITLTYVMEPSDTPTTTPIPTEPPTTSTTEPPTTTEPSDAIDGANTDEGGESPQTHQHPDDCKCMHTLPLPIVTSAHALTQILVTNSSPVFEMNVLQSLRERLVEFSRVQSNLVGLNFGSYLSYVDGDIHNACTPSQPCLSFRMHNINNDVYFQIVDLVLMEDGKEPHASPRCTP